LICATVGGDLASTRSPER